MRLATPLIAVLSLAVAACALTTPEQHPLVVSGPVRTTEGWEWKNCGTSWTLSSRFRSLT